jgi:hypothetical protein
MLTILMVFICAFQVGATTNQELIKNLSSRLYDLSEDRGTLIKSFSNSSQSYIYDQALAIIAFTQENDSATAKKLLRGLDSLQLSDGSLYFSYYLDGKSPYPDEGDKRFAGAIAWVALAAIHYQHKFKSKEFIEFNFQILSYLQSQIRPVQINGVSVQAVSFAPNDISNTSLKENEIAALEHNLDAYVAFEHFSKINKIKTWETELKDINRFILTLWDKEESHFWSGANFKSGQINKGELYLDNQTWSLLALDGQTLRNIKPELALKFNCDNFYVKHEGISGFMDSKPTLRTSSYKFVWSEGSLGHILAMKKMNKSERKSLTCPELTSDDFLNSIKKMKKNDGGIAYSTKTDNPDFTTASSVAGTAWMYFAINDFNPFQLDGLD